MRKEETEKRRKEKTGARQEKIRQDKKERRLGTNVKGKDKDEDEDNDNDNDNDKDKDKDKDKTRYDKTRYDKKERRLGDKYQRQRNRKENTTT